MAASEPAFPSLDCTSLDCILIEFPNDPQKA